MKTFRLLALLTVLFTSAVTGCSFKDSLASYRITFHGEWIQERFPKQYPKWRPHAQWSVVVGRTHSSSYSLWRLGQVVSEGVRMFIIQGKVERLHQETAQGSKGIFDEFYMPALTRGTGTTESQFLVAANNSRVSLLARIIPSPDWFVGVDSFDLCRGGSWLKEVDVELSPLDAGLDNGFAFTSPKWATEFAEPVTRITAHHPNHRANSFYYPDIEKLPRIGYFHMSKIKEYKRAGNNKRHRGHKMTIRHKDMEADASLPGPQTQMNLTPTESNDNINVKGRFGKGNKHNQEPTSSPQQEANRRHYAVIEGTVAKKVGTYGSGIMIPREEPSFAVQNDGQVSINTVGDNVEDSQNRKDRKNLRKPNKSKNMPRDCLVSDWSEWSPCSQSCGPGQMTRQRRMMKPARRRGRPCPPLQETHWCTGRHVDCPTVTLSKTYFRWD